LLGLKGRFYLKEKELDISIRVKSINLEDNELRFETRLSDCILDIEKNKTFTLVLKSKTK
jgi:hypothetical protein